MNKYYLIVKTGDAEIKALENTSGEVLDAIVPIIELTRGRKVPSKEKDPIKRAQEVPRYPYQKRLERICEIFANRKIIFDLTSDDSLMSQEIKFLYDWNDNYRNWREFLISLKQSSKLGDIIPSLIIHADDPDIDNSLINQTKLLTRDFDAIAYRSDIYDDNCYYDIQNISTALNGKQLYLIIDCSYIIQANISQYIKKIEARINNLQKILPQNTNIIVSATSFPRNIGEIGDDVAGVFTNSEVVIYNALIERKLDVNYSDYGSINPVRNDGIVMAHGWIPRIDVPLADRFFYYRERRPRSTKEYAATYCRVAQNILKNQDFPYELKKNWGIRQIQSCALGSSPGSTPSFWISVRMCIHLEQQVKRLRALDI